MSFTLDGKSNNTPNLNDSFDEAYEVFFIGARNNGEWAIGNIGNSSSPRKFDFDYYTFNIETRNWRESTNNEEKKITEAGYLPNLNNSDFKIYTNGPPFEKYINTKITIASGIPYSDEIINQDSYVDDGSIKLALDRFGWTIDIINSSREIIKTIIVGMDDESFTIPLTRGTYFIKVSSYDKENSGLIQDYNGRQYGIRLESGEFNSQLDLEYDKSEFSYLYAYDPIKFEYLNPGIEFSYLTPKYLSQFIPNNQIKLEPIQLESLSGTSNYSIGNDIIVLTGSGDTERGLGGDDYYLISDLIPTNSNINIVDTAGLNTIQITDGTFIDKTLFTKNAVRITLEDSRVITINGADKFEYNIGANITSGDTSNDLSFSDFALIFGLTDILNSSGTLDGPVIDVYVL